MLWVPHFLGVRGYCFRPEAVTIQIARKQPYNAISKFFVMLAGLDGIFSSRCKLIAPENPIKTKGLRQ